MLGNSDISKGYRIWIHNERLIEISRDVKFLEEIEQSLENFKELIPEEVIENKCQEEKIDKEVFTELSIRWL